MTEILSNYLPIQRDQSKTINGAVITRGDKSMELAASTAQEYLGEKRFFGDCKCRPVVNEIAGFVRVAGEDDYPVHGYTSDDELRWQ